MNRQKQIRMAKEIVKYVHGHIDKVSYTVLLANVVKIISKYTYTSKR
jgi:hypothetical protein